MYSPKVDLRRGAAGPVVRLSGRWTSTLSREIPDDVAAIELNYSLGWRGEDLAFLEQFPDLKALRLISYAPVDLCGLNKCRRLRALSVGLVNRERLDLANFPDLEDCRLGWQRTYSGLEACAGLKRLWLSGLASSDAGFLANFPKLIDLSFASLPLQTCDGLRSCPDLAFVGLYHCRKLNDISALGSATKLRWLEIMDCKSMTRIDAIAACDNLEHVELIDCGHIESLSPLFGKQRLQHLIFYGETDISDGRLSPLLQLPNLSTVAFKPRRHYDASRDSFRTDSISDPQPSWRFDWWADSAGKSPANVE